MVDTRSDTLAEMEAVKLDDTQGDVQPLIDTLAVTVAEEGAVGDTRSAVQALIDTVAERLSRGRGGDTMRETGRDSG